jgi:hypothetical protein
MTEDLDEYTTKVIREAENIAYSTRTLKQVGKLPSVIQRGNITPYAIINVVLWDALKRTRDPQKRSDLEELFALWGELKQEIKARYPKTVD